MNNKIRKFYRNTCLYKKYFKPYVLDRWKIPKMKMFAKYSLNLLDNFLDAMNGENVVWWFEFGTLLGMYRDNDFIKGDIDLDFGAYLKDSEKIHSILTTKGFELVREFHEIGSDKIERTYFKDYLTLDIFFFYPEENKMCANGFYGIQKRKKGYPTYNGVCRFYFTPFNVIPAVFKGRNVMIPDNAEQHITEVYGPNWRIPDPNFKDGFNKIKFDFSERKGIGYFVK